MLAYLGNVSGYEGFLLMSLVFLIPFVLGIWLVIEIIRYLRRH